MNCKVRIMTNLLMQSKRIFLYLLEEKLTSFRYFHITSSVIFLYITINQKSLAANVVTPPSTSLSLFQTTLGLIIVIGLILLAAWLVRKVGPHMNSQSIIHVITAASIGPREKVVIVEINDNWLVLGVTNNQVNLLQTLPKGNFSAINTDNSSSKFLLKLKEVMKRNG